MESPPAKRQRRSTIILPEDEEYASDAQLPLRASTKPNTARLSRSQKDEAAIPSSKPATKGTRTKAHPIPSPKSSPEKSKQKNRTKKEPATSKSIQSFFGKASEAQRWNRKDSTPDENIDDGEFGDDIVDDDSLDDALLELVDDKGSADSGLDRRKHTSFSSGSASGASQKQAPISSQRFAKPTIPITRSMGSDQRNSSFVKEDDHRPWSERYAPTNLEELAVNRRKVGDVQGWLNDVLSGRDRRRMLVLKGPAGSGKSTTLSILAKELGIQLIAWTNPTAFEQGSKSTVAVEFDEFLNRSGRFGSLSFGVSPDTADVTGITLSNRVLVVDEFPTALTQSSPAMDSFRSALLQHLAAGAPSQLAMFDKRQPSLESQTPLVMIITETLLTSATAAADSFTAHRLLGSEISDHPLVTIMDFNPVAPTFALKALDLVIKKEARDSKRRRMPGPAVLSKLAEIGDLRSAFNSLEFLCVRGDQNGNWSGTVAAKAKRGTKDSVPLTSMEKSSLELVSQRETTLDMFHATGKVVYNKREDPRMADTRAEPPPKPPDHLMHLDKPKVSQVDIGALLNETGTDIQTFLSSLHENYVLSCNGSSFVEAFGGCSDFLSDSDLLNPDTRPLKRFSRSSGRQNYQGGGTDMLRQDEISFQVATRGLLFCLPFPINRAAHPGGRKGDSFKMFYPASLRLWKPTEEIESLVSLFMSTSCTQAGFASTSDGVASWAARASGTFLESRNDEHDLDGSTTQQYSGRTYTSRDELSLEVLPYLTRIRTSRKEDTKTLSKIAQFHGLHITESAGEESDDDELAQPGLVRPLLPQKPNMNVATALSRFDQSQSQRQSLAAGTGHASSSFARAQEDVAMEKLYISDDDIQDD